MQYWVVWKIIRRRNAAHGRSELHSYRRQATGVLPPLGITHPLRLQNSFTDSPHHGDGNRVAQEIIACSTRSLKAKRLGKAKKTQPLAQRKRTQPLTVDHIKFFHIGRYERRRYVARGENLVDLEAELLITFYFPAVSDTDRQYHSNAGS